MWKSFVGLVLVALCLIRVLAVGDHDRDADSTWRSEDVNGALPSYCLSFVMDDEVLFATIIAGNLCDIDKNN